MLYAPWTAKLEPNPADPILQGYRIRDARGIVVAEAFNRPYPVIVDQEHADTIAAAPAYRSALEAAEHWLAEEAASPHPGQTRPDDILRVIRDALGKPHDAPDAADAAPQTPDASALMLEALRLAEERIEMNNYGGEEDEHLAVIRAAIATGEA